MHKFFIKRGALIGHKLALFTVQIGNQLAVGQLQKTTYRKSPS